MTHTGERPAFPQTGKIIDEVVSYEQLNINNFTSNIVSKVEEPLSIIVWLNSKLKFYYFILNFL